jgi:tryptophan synthase alpha chain
MPSFDEMLREKEQSPRLVGYLPALYPDEDTYRDLLSTCAENGLRYIEIGIPVATPYLDGKSITDALLHVHEREGDDVSSLIKRSVRISHEVGLVGIVMLYYETVLEYGLVAFAQLCIEAKVDAVLIPNITNDGLETLSGLLSASSVKTVNFIRYEADDAEIEHIISNTTGFIYLQSMRGTTGGRFTADVQLKRKVEHVKHMVRSKRLPVALGFGISTPENAVEAATTAADAIIIGTGFVEAAMGGVDEVNSYLDLFTPYLMQSRVQVEMPKRSVKSRHIPLVPVECTLK